MNGLGTLVLVSNIGSLVILTAHQRCLVRSLKTRIDLLILPALRLAIPAVYMYKIFRNFPIRSFSNVP